MKDITKAEIWEGLQYIKTKYGTIFKNPLGGDVFVFNDEMNKLITRQYWEKLVYGEIKTYELEKLKDDV